MTGAFSQTQLMTLMLLFWFIFALEPANAAPEGKVQHNIKTCGSIADSESSTSLPGALKSRKALLVGINEYADPDIPDLAGSVNDVCLMRRVLVEVMGYKDSDISILTNSDATRAAIITELSLFEVGSKKGEQNSFLFFYAGHGSQVMDDDGDEAGFDGKDETLLPHDAIAKSGRNDLRDDVLQSIFGQIAQHHSSVLVILDACNSGTALRSAHAPRLHQRGVEVVSLAEPPSIGAIQETSWRDLPLNLTLVTSASERQLANEISRDGLVHGAFTYAFAQALRRYGPSARGRQLINHTRSMLERYGVYDQTPTINGGMADKVWTVGSGSNSLERQFVASHIEENRYRISSGIISGDTLGSVYNLVSAYGDKKSYFAEVTELTPFSAIVTVQESDAPAKDMTAVKRRHAYKTDIPRVFVVEGNPDILSEVKAALEASQKAFRLTRLRAEADYLMSVHIGGAVTIWSDTGALLSELVSPREAVELIDKWEFWTRVRQIDSSGSRHLVSAEVIGPRCDSASARPETSLLRSCFLSEAEGPRISVFNQSPGRVWINIIALNPNGDVLQLMQPREIEPQHGFTTSPLGVRNTEDRPETTTIKVFASTQFVDLSAFQQQSLRSERQSCQSPELDDLNRLLCTAQNTTRSELSLDVDGWSVEDLSIVVLPHDQ